MDAFLSSFPSFAPPYTLVVGLLAVYVAISALYRLFFSPLHSVPGPWYAAVSDFWLTTHVLRFRRCRAIDGLLRKYGPIVRVAPNKVIFLDAPTMKDVYGVSSKLDKSAFYKCLTTNANDHAMTTLDHGSHNVRKRGYAPHYTPANLGLFQPEIHKCTNDLVDMLSISSTISPMAIDTLLLFRHFFIDINCFHLFDYDANSLKAWSQHILHGSPPDELIRAISDFPKRGLLKGALPGWLWDLVQLIPIRRWRIFCDSDALVGRFTVARLHEIRVLLFSGKDYSDQEARRPLMARLLAHKYSEQEVMPDKDVVSECVGHLVAGTDTTSTTLSYLLWELSRRPDIMQRLQAEVDECMPDPSHIPDIQELHRLPYLSAVIKEGLRVYSAAPSPLERIVPSHRDSEINLLGYTMAPGTIIASQAFSSHRHPDVFFCPDLFLPDRWLLEDPLVSRPLASIPSINGRRTAPAASQPVSSASQNLDLSSSQVLSETEKGPTATASALPKLPMPTSQTEMSAHMFPFGRGPRVCGGQNLAQIMLRIVLVTIARNFDIVAPSETNEQSMAMCDSFVAFPASLKCKLIFVPRRRQAENSVGISHRH